MFKDRNLRRRPETTRPRETRGRRTVHWRWLLALVPVLLVAGATYVLLRSPLLTVQQVSLEGTESLDQEALIEISALEGESMLRLPLDAARRRLLAVPAVGSISFDRSWPSSVTIVIEERKPVAFWSVNGHDYVVDQQGVVLAAGAPDGPAPRIIDVTPGSNLKPGDRVQPDAIAFAQRITAEAPEVLGASLMRLEYRQGVGVTAVFEDGLRVTFGDQRSYEYKVAVLSQLLGQLGEQGIEPHAVDLRFGQRVTYE